MTATFDLASVDREVFERRRFRRVPATLPLRWSAPLTGHPEWIDADTVNVGAGGLLVRSPMAGDIEPGTLVCISMGLADRQVVAIAECCGARGPEDADGCGELVFRFTAMGRGSMRALVHAVVELETA